MTNKLTDFSKLSTAIRELGIAICKESKRIRKELLEGIDVTESTPVVRGTRGLYYVLPNGAIQKVILSITQKKAFTEADLHEANWHKYHVLNCQTLQSYPPERRHRYKMASRHDGRFRYTLIYKNQIVRELEGRDGAQLALCMNCERDYRDLFGRDFDLKEFMTSNLAGGEVIGTKSYDFDDVPALYAAEWSGIAAGQKAKKEWICEACRINLSAPDLRRFLHGHHQDGNPANNELANIRILCIECHSKQPLHGHIRRSPDYEAFRNTDAFSRKFDPST